VQSERVRRPRYAASQSRKSPLLSIQMVRRALSRWWRAARRLFGRPALSYCFRLRFRLGERVRIVSSETRLRLANPAGREEITLRAVDDGMTIGDSRDLALVGKAYASEQAAFEAGTRWRGILEKALARQDIGADFGDRAPASHFTEAGLQMLAQQVNQRVIADVHGLMAFECEPWPRFARSEAAAVVGKPADRVVQTVAIAARLGLAMSDRQRLAYDVYSASFSGTNADARFMLLMMALETLFEPTPRSEAVRAHVDVLIAETTASGLPPNEVESLRGSLRWLKTESISQTGRRVARRLGDRRYMDERPATFFTRCYTLRNGLAHGHSPRPPRETVDGRAAALELFVRDLLSTELLDQIEG
jgi:hypothetical protein